MDYMVVGTETAPSSGSTHYHVFIQFKGKKRFTQLKGMYPGANLSDNDGKKPEAGREYVIKDGEYKEFGQFKPAQAKRKSRKEERQDIYQQVKRGEK